MILYVVITLIAFFNAITIKHLKKRLENGPKVSVIIPARNEEKNIGTLLKNLKAQSYPHETIVVDDHSTDNTAKIAKQFKIKVVKGKELPKDWRGKPWACFQGAKKAKGDYYLFLDADIQLSTHALAKIMYRKGPFINVFPKQIMKNFGEWIVVPLLNWVLLSFLPVYVAMRVKNRALNAANGQCMLFEKKNYWNLGGHEAVKNKVVEDMEFARIQQPKIYFSHDVQCRMYRSYKEAFRGFAKSLFLSTNAHPIPFVIVVILLAIGLFVPLFTDPFVYVFIILNWVFVSLVTRDQPLGHIVFHPLHMIILIKIALVSAFKRKSLQWKGRNISQN